jgi:hypothetical protein
MPALVPLFSNANNHDPPNNTIWSQQDGAPPHYAINVRRYVTWIKFFQEDGYVEEIRWNGRLGLLH